MEVEEEHQEDEVVSVLAAEAVVKAVEVSQEVEVVDLLLGVEVVRGEGSLVVVDKSAVPALVSAFGSCMVFRAATGICIKRASSHFT